MFKILRWFFGRKVVELTPFQAAIAANIVATSNHRTLWGPIDSDLDLAA